MVSYCLNQKKITMKRLKNLNVYIYFVLSISSFIYGWLRSKKSKKEESTMTSSSPAKSSFQCGRFKYNSDKVPQISPFSTSAIQEFPPAQGDPASYAYIKKKFSRIPQFSPVALSKQRVLEIKSFDKNKEDREIQKDKFIDAQQRQIAIDKWVKKHRRNSNKKKRMHTRNRNVWFIYF